VGPQGKDFRVCRSKNGTAKKGCGGHNAKDYLLTADAAKVVMMDDDSEFDCSARAIWERAGKLYGTFRKGRQQTLIFISEFRLYEVLIRSDKPLARPFRKSAVCTT
jgi:prophage antirepressor-like protein